jgi:hypothetical protein
MTTVDDNGPVLRLDWSTQVKVIQTKGQFNLNPGHELPYLYISSYVSLVWVLCESQVQGEKKRGQLHGGTKRPLVI